MLTQYNIIRLNKNVIEQIKKHSSKSFPKVKYISSAAEQTTTKGVETLTCLLR